MLLLIVTTEVKRKTCVCKKNVENHVYFILLHFSKDFVHSANICYTRVTTFYKTSYLTSNRTFFAYLLSCMTTFYTRYDYYLNTNYYLNTISHVLSNIYYHTSLYFTKEITLRELRFFLATVTTHDLHSTKVYEHCMSSEHPLQYISL